MVGIHSIIAVAVVTVVTLPLTAAQPYWSSTCAGGTYAANSSYHGNLELLAAALPANASATPAGFAKGTVGAVPNQVSALALCRGDTNATACRKCVAAAFPGAQRDCSDTKDVTFYQDDCVVRFSDQRFLDFIGVNSPYAVSSSDDDNLTVPAASFDAAVAALMSATVDRAVAADQPSNSTSSKYFATAVMDFDAHYPEIYGLAQCVPDMTAAQCRGCLGSLLASMPGFLNGKPGGRSLGIWCNLRYNVRPFFTARAMLHLPAPAPAPAPATVVPSICAPETGSGRKRRAAVGISVGVACSVVLILIFSAVALIHSKRKNATKNDLFNNATALEKMARAKCMIFDFLTLQEATENFSEDRKLGEGGFGVVYKGKLPDGQEIAVKKLLDSATGQALLQLQNEVRVLATLQHKNLVRLHGFCVHQNEMMLVYEFIKNGTLDTFLFEDTRTGNKLSWDQQYNIIVGIAKGIMYLHDDSRIRIIHRDLKANNILLDENADPKIADFGLARLLGDHSQTKTATVAGTYGYMAPEYAIHGNVSPKVDIFSFGVLVLEIVTRRRNTGFDDSDTTVNLLSDVWNSWTTGMISEMMDQTLEGYSRTQALKCIQIGLLCTQPDPDDRPNISSVVFMLTRDNMELQAPAQPAFFFGRDSPAVPQPYEQHIYVYDRSDVILQEDISLNELLRPCPIRILRSPRAMPGPSARFGVLALLAALALPFATAELHWSNCDSSSGSYSAGSAYQDNLQQVVSALGAKIANASSAASPDLFATAGAGAGRDAVHGLVLCRGDLSFSDCQDCVISAQQDVENSCSKRTKDVALCYNLCYVRVSNTDFLASTNNSGELLLISGTNISSGVDVAAYDAAVTRLLNATARYAVEESARMFATGQLVGLDPEIPSIWSAAQCALDLSPEQCRRCLGDLVARWWQEFPLNGRGGRQDRWLAVQPEVRAGFVLHGWRHGEAADARRGSRADGGTSTVADPEQKTQLDWRKRFNIIEGVARGLQYLHEDSQKKIVHRDMKASNVLLDTDMNPKIGDFGLAKLFGQDQTRDVTSRIVGTFGYMSPEYVMRGQYSTKLDVFSFGILVIEIVTGRKNCGQNVPEHNDDVISTNPVDRPTMSDIMVMLDGDASSLPAPPRPTFLIEGSSGYSYSTLSHLSAV
ncbi:Cysteine-rich receptor-like protein kinase 10 [Dichanthelium oligosanthes]|uniref:Cysteine-rich receptor-like protein kinase 10 n=1 Tax=Dichanthelium oligosanthes TaxID=888268 RepID=A0A1E5VJ01_9POAL|nr:Cysteine-rich receptor-like protein kinase 10 [Dichanthelium oligosanthes]